MFFVTLMSVALAPENVVWHEDFLKASLLAKEQKKDLVIHFRADEQLDKALESAEVCERLKQFVCVRLPMDYMYKGERMIDRAPLAPMLGKPGICVVSRRDETLPYHDSVISAHPHVGSHYRWVPKLGAREVSIILDLPPKATLSQRAMIYAVTIHPDGPKSVNGSSHSAFLAHAESHSGRQAALRNQHHADIISVMSRLSNQVGGANGGSEVVAESWGAFVGGEHLLEACYSCVDAWRQSSGHWGAVMREHKYFGYDISQGSNGTWYATGIFAE